MLKSGGKKAAYREVNRGEGEEEDKKEEEYRV